MKADQLAQDVQEARISDFGDDTYGFPHKYFNHNVRNIAPNGVATPRSPKHCATAFGAGQLLAVLYEEKNFIAALALGPANGWGGLQGGFSDTEPVPYLEIQTSDPANPRHVNVGFVLEHFNHGHPANVALEAAMKEIEEAIQ